MAKVNSGGRLDEPSKTYPGGLRMAEALEEKGKVYALRIYDRDGHSLPRNRDDRDRMIIDWFNRASQGGQ